MATQLASAPDERVWRVSVKRYHEMISKGILSSDDRVELLEGVIVSKMSKNPPHCFVTRAVRDAIVPLLDGWHDRLESPVTLSASEPEPDLAIVRGSFRDYGNRHPGPQDIAIIVEVCDSTQRRDRVTKKRIYARARIPVYWIADVSARKFEIHRNPDGRGRYRVTDVIDAQGSIPVEIEGNVIGYLNARDLLPPLTPA